MISIIWLKSPYLFSSLIKITPPSESHKQPASDIFDNPEIDSPKYSNQNKSSNKTENIPKEEISALAGKIT